MGRKQVIRANDVARAKKDLNTRLDHPAPAIDRDGDGYWGPAVVCASTTWGDFERWLDVNDGRMRRWVFEPLNDGTGKGRVVIYGQSTFVHANTESSIQTSITMQIQRAGDDINLIGTVRGGQVTCITGSFGQEPNASLRPVDLSVGGVVMAAIHNFPFPNVIVEVAYKNESLSNLRAKLQRWMDPAYSSVQVAMGIKIFAGPVTSRRLTILHRRGHPIQEVEFGLEHDHPLPLTFPLGAIYFGVHLPPVLDGLEDRPISIDLVSLRAVINTAVQREIGD
ncbi:hypothetical protein P3T76_005481 [Phytophthora citrophthora]|uniref:Uncharacterized protein n=1 Tax=Phytophthora citrophthora TaxID=4793 RepID=A0AAD9GQN8_9STRA|nr:hypothetical protein P3T76_005481 [Phytophthora citrophthora]